jgi:hypothetical protein
VRWRAGDSEQVTRWATRAGTELASETNVSGEAADHNLRSEVHAALSSQGVNGGREAPLPCFPGRRNLIQRGHCVQPQAHGKAAKVSKFMIYPYSFSLKICHSFECCIHWISQAAMYYWVFASACELN